MSAEPREAGAMQPAPWATLSGDVLAGVMAWVDVPTLEAMLCTCSSWLRGCKSVLAELRPQALGRPRLDAPFAGTTSLSLPALRKRGRRPRPQLTYPAPLAGSLQHLQQFPALGYLSLEGQQLPSSFCSILQLHLAGLKFLDLSSCSMPAAALQGLTQLRALTSLIADNLHLRHTVVPAGRQQRQQQEASMVQALFASPHLQQLRLNYTSSSVAAPGCTLQLCWSPAALAAATALTSLGLLQHRMTPGLWRALAGCTKLQRLAVTWDRSLDLTAEPAPVAAGAGADAAGAGTQPPSSVAPGASAAAAAAPQSGPAGPPWSGMRRLQHLTLHRIGPEASLDDLLEQQEAAQQQQLQQLRQRQGQGLATGVDIELPCVDGGMGVLAGSLRSLKLIGCDDVDVGLGLMKLTALTQLEVVSPGADLSTNLLVEAIHRMPHLAHFTIQGAHMETRFEAPADALLRALNTSCTSLVSAELGGLLVSGTMLPHSSAAAEAAGAAAWPVQELVCRFPMLRSKLPALRYLVNLRALTLVNVLPSDFAASCRLNCFNTLSALSRLTSLALLGVGDYTEEAPPHPQLPGMMGGWTPATPPGAILPPPAAQPGAPLAAVDGGAGWLQQLLNPAGGAPAAAPWPLAPPHLVQQLQAGWEAAQMGQMGPAEPAPVAQMLQGMQAAMAQAAAAAALPPVAGPAQGPPGGQAAAAWWEQQLQQQQQQQEGEEAVGEDGGGGGGPWQLEDDPDWPLPDDLQPVLPAAGPAPLGPAIAAADADIAAAAAILADAAGGGGGGGAAGAMPPALGLPGQFGPGLAVQAAQAAQAMQAAAAAQGAMQAAAQEAMQAAAEPFPTSGTTVKGMLEVLQGHLAALLQAAQRCMPNAHACPEQQQAAADARATYGPSKAAALWHQVRALLQAGSGAAAAQVAAEAALAAAKQQQLPERLLLGQEQLRGWHELAVASAAAAEQLSAAQVPLPDIVLDTHSKQYDQLLDLLIVMDRDITSSASIAAAEAVQVWELATGLAVERWVLVAHQRWLLAWAAALAALQQLSLLLDAAATAVAAAAPGHTSHDPSSSSSSSSGWLRDTAGQLQQAAGALGVAGRQQQEGDAGSSRGGGKAGTSSSLLCASAWDQQPLRVAFAVQTALEGVRRIHLAGRDPGVEQRHAPYATQQETIAAVSCDMAEAFAAACYQSRQQLQALQLQAAAAAALGAVQQRLVGRLQSALPADGTCRGVVSGVSWQQQMAAAGDVRSTARVLGKAAQAAVGVLPPADKAVPAAVQLAQWPLHVVLQQLWLLPGAAVGAGSSGGVAGVSPPAAGVPHRISEHSAGPSSAGASPSGIHISRLAVGGDSSSPADDDGDGGAQPPLQNHAAQQQQQQQQEEEEEEGQQQPQPAQQQQQQQLGQAQAPSPDAEGASGSSSDMSWASLPSTEFQDAESAPGDSPVHPAAAAAAGASSAAPAAAAGGRAAAGRRADMRLLDLSGDMAVATHERQGPSTGPMHSTLEAVAAAAGLPVGGRAVPKTQEPHLNWLASLRMLEHLELTALPPCEGVCLHHLGPLTRLTQLSLGKRLQLTTAGLRCLSSLRLPALKLLLVEGADTRAAPARELLAALAAAAPAVEVIKVGRCRGVSSVDIGQLLGQCQHLRHLEVVGAKLGKAPVVWAVWGAERRSQLQRSTPDAAAAAAAAGCRASSSRGAAQARVPAGTTGPGWHPVRFVGARSSEVHRPDGSPPSMFDVTASGSGAGLSGQQLWDWSWLNR